MDKSGNRQGGRRGTAKRPGTKPGPKPGRRNPVSARPGTQPPVTTSLRKRLGRWLLVAVALVCMAPLVLTLFYRIPAIQPISTLMISKRIAGKQAARTWVSLGEVSPFVYQSVVSSEDGRFCIHGGVDWVAVNLVVDDLIEGERPRGASTIPMQTVKNLFLWPDRSYIRKLLEVPLALFADLVWSKPRMMEIYLNIAEWGPGIFGIEAAAQHYFKRSAKRLTRKQSALLAVTLPNPILRNPRKPSRGMSRLARLVEKRARRSGAYVACLR